MLAAVQNYRLNLTALPPVQTGPGDHVARISGRGEAFPSPVPATVDPAQGRLLDLLRTGGGMPTPTGYLSTRGGDGLIHLIDGWGHPLIYQVADPRPGATAALRAIDGFWAERTGSADRDGRYPVVYSVGPLGLRSEAPTQADAFFWGQDPADIVTEDP